MFPSQTIAKALQEYGVYIMDSTSGGLGLYALNPNSLSIDPYNDLILITVTKNYHSIVVLKDILFW